MGPLAGGRIESRGDLRHCGSWHELDDGAARVEAVLREAGDHETTLEREPDSRGYSSFGRTVWSLPAAASSMP